MLEPDASLPNERHPIEVKFDAQVPQPIVVHALRAILESIEGQGLPELVTEMERAEFALIREVQHRIAKMEPELYDAFDRIVKKHGGSDEREGSDEEDEEEKRTVMRTKITKLSGPGDREQ
jgi:hypothetical protein